MRNCRDGSKICDDGHTYIPCVQCRKHVVSLKESPAMINTSTILRAYHTCNDCHIQDAYSRVIPNPYSHNLTSDSFKRHEQVKLLYALWVVMMGQFLITKQMLRRNTDCFM